MPGPAAPAAPPLTPAELSDAATVALRYSQLEPKLRALAAPPALQLSADALSPAFS